MKKFAKVCVLFVSSSVLYGMDSISRDLSELEKSLMKSEIDELRERIEMVEKHHKDIMNILRGRPELVIMSEVLQVIPDEKRTPAQKQLAVFRKFARDMHRDYVLPTGEFNVEFYLERKERIRKSKLYKDLAENLDGYIDRKKKELVVEEAEEKRQPDVDAFKKAEAEYYEAKRVRETFLATRQEYKANRSSKKRSQSDSGPRSPRYLCSSEKQHKDN